MQLSPVCSRGNRDEDADAAHSQNTDDQKVHGALSKKCPLMWRGLPREAMFKKHYWVSAGMS